MAISSEQIISDSITAITTEASYKSWLAGIKIIGENDIILLNNSFIYRDVITTKSDKYLGLQFFQTAKIKDYYVIEG